MMNMQKDDFTKIYLVVIGCLFLLIGLFIAGKLLLERVPGQVTPEQITIYANDKTGQAKPLIGFLYGITYDNSKDYTKTINLLNALKPSSWRLSTYNNVYEFVVNVAKFPTTQNTDITVVLQDVFHQKYGWTPPAIVDSTCPPAVDDRCFVSYEELRGAWASLADSFMKQAVSQGIKMDYLDIFSEPGETWVGVTGEQKLELFKIAHDIARSYKPAIKIVVPSLMSYQKENLETILTYAIQNNLRIDAVSWHEFVTPDIVPQHVAEIRQFITANPSLCNPTCPEIHINEYSVADHYVIPGWNVGWLYYFEKAGVDWASRACWDVVSGPGGWSTCWDAPGGIFLEDGVTTTHTYWVYQLYAGMNHTRLRSEGTTKTVAIADRDDTQKELKILIGRYNYNGVASDVNITVKDYPFTGSKASAEIWKIPENENKLLALEGPIKVESQILNVSRKEINLSITSFKDGEAYYFVLTPL